MNNQVASQDRVNPTSHPSNNTDIDSTLCGTGRGSGSHVPEPRRPVVDSDIGAIAEQIAEETTQAGDQHVRSLVRRVVATDGVLVPRHHVLVVTVDKSADEPEVSNEGGESDGHSGRFDRRVHVRVLVVGPR
jgi:hypothetical protein